jgi:hypothetical protein
MVSSRTEIEPDSLRRSEENKGADINNTMDILKMYMRSTKKDQEEEGQEHLETVQPKKIKSSLAP